MRISNSDVALSGAFSFKQTDKVSTSLEFMRPDFHRKENYEKLREEERSGQSTLHFGPGSISRATSLHSKVTLEEAYSVEETIGDNVEISAEAREAAGGDNQSPASKALENLRASIDHAIEEAKAVEAQIKQAFETAIAGVPAFNATPAVSAQSFISSPEDNSKFNMIMKLIGKEETAPKIKYFMSVKPKISPDEVYDALQNLIESKTNSISEQEAGEIVGIMEERVSTYHSEKESMDFNAQGRIETADGRKIDISMQLNQARQYSTTEEYQRSQIWVDPLVINYGKGSAELSDSKVKFDLNSDGKEENISMLKEGSGFLALDKNGDNTINNGRELFGASTGNGFGELAKYDQDGNHWIDENDSIFEDLKIWTRGEDGTDKLVNLKDADVGAIFLGSVATKYNLKDSDNETTGRIRQSGIALSESGNSLTVQQIDLLT